jgi:hypothetical protein
VQQRLYIISKPFVSFGPLVYMHTSFPSLRRLINVIADDNAIEDTIYHLHRALNVGRIDLERFLRVCPIHC